MFRCPVCRKMHEVKFHPDFAKNRIKYPFSHVFLHKVEDTENIDDLDKDVLTTLYVDANLNIRGVEAIITEDNTNILSKEDSKMMISKLTQTILQMQEDYDSLNEKYEELLKKINGS